jgi:hypothetical protein
LFWDRDSLYSPGWPPTHDLSTSASQVLQLQACASTPGWDLICESWSKWCHKRKTKTRFYL